MPWAEPQHSSPESPQHHQAPFNSSGNWDLVNSNVFVNPDRGCPSEDPSPIPQEGMPRAGRGSQAEFYPEQKWGSPESPQCHPPPPPNRSQALLSSWNTSKSLTTCRAGRRKDLERSICTGPIMCPSVLHHQSWQSLLAEEKWRLRGGKA